MSEHSYQVGDIVASMIATGGSHIRPGDTGVVKGFRGYLVEVSWHGKQGLLKNKPEYGITDMSGWNFDPENLVLVEPVGGAFTAPERSDLEDFFKSV